MLPSIRNDFVTRFNYNSELKLYVMSFTEEWTYTEEKTRSGEVITDKRRIYLHFYYNDQKATDDKVRFNAMLDRLENNLINGTPDPGELSYIRSTLQYMRHRKEEGLILLMRRLSERQSRTMAILL